MLELLRIENKVDRIKSLMGFIINIKYSIISFLFLNIISPKFKNINVPKTKNFPINLNSL